MTVLPTNLLDDAEHSDFLGTLRQKCPEQSVAVNQRRVAFKNRVEVQRRSTFAPTKGMKVKE